VKVSVDGLPGGNPVHCHLIARKALSAPGTSTYKPSRCLRFIEPFLSGSTFVDADIVSLYEQPSALVLSVVS
jgi:hypothetical protein